MEFNLADLFEHVVDAVGDRVALHADGRTLTYRELDQRANRLAHHFAEAGIGAGDHVGCHLMNGSEYLETMLALLKIRAVPSCQTSPDCDTYWPSANPTSRHWPPNPTTARVSPSDPPTTC
jgi:non-ribosomal peptide synthetase component E (peptide arylation enzyme)